MVIFPYEVGRRFEPCWSVHFLLRLDKLVNVINIVCVVSHLNCYTSSLNHRYTFRPLRPEEDNACDQKKMLPLIRVYNRHYIILIKIKIARLALPTIGILAYYLSLSNYLRP